MSVPIISTRRDSDALVAHKLAYYDLYAGYLCTHACSSRERVHTRARVHETRGMRLGWQQRNAIVLSHRRRTLVESLLSVSRTCARARADLRASRFSFAVLLGACKSLLEDTLDVII